MGSQFKGTVHCGGEAMGQELQAAVHSAPAARKLHITPGLFSLAGSTNPVPRILTLITFLSLLASFPVGTLHVVARAAPTAESSTLPVRKTQ